MLFAAPGPEIVTSGRCAPGTEIKTIAACSGAAEYLGLPDVTASDDGQRNGVSSDPRFCYYEDGQLKFNKGNNNGIQNLANKTF